MRTKGQARRMIEWLDRNARGILSLSVGLVAMEGSAFGSPIRCPDSDLRADPIVATFSCVGYDPETGDLGVVVQSKFFAVGAVVPWARTGIGAIATQAFANTTYGPDGLAMLAEGKTADQTVRALTEADSLRERRQVGIVDAEGRSSSFTGKECMTWAGGIAGTHFAAQGNILAGHEVVEGMAKAFERTEGMLGDRLMAAIEAGQAAGGDSRGMQSAALLIVRKGGGYAGFNDRYCDLRVDDAEDPIRELRRIYNLWKPNALIQEGYNKVERGEFDRAYALGREAVALQPASAEARYHLSCYYSRGEKSREALDLLEEALTLDPSLAKRARTDPDLIPLRDDSRFRSLVPMEDR